MLCENKNVLNPLYMFQRLAEMLNNGEYKDESVDETVFYTFDFYRTQATEDFLYHVYALKEITTLNRIPCISSRCVVKYSKNRKSEYLAIDVFEYKSLVLYENKSKKFMFADREHLLRYVFYDKGVVWNCLENLKRHYPCTLKDFFLHQSDKCNAAYIVICKIFEIWSEEYIIWRDLKSDFENGSAYSSIPLDVIFSCNTRKELLQKRYGFSLKRNNRETIGQGIFLVRASRVVGQNNIQKLYGADIPPCFIGRNKTDIIKPLGNVLYDRFCEQCPNEKPDKHLISDTINMCIQFKRIMPLTFNSFSELKKLHDKLSILATKKLYPVVRIPKNSVFSTLKMPSNCKRLTTRTQFIEEGTYQHNCVASYITSVNKDICSIWSMRKEDGSRVTIEIRCRKSKNNPNGYFFIKQMRAFANSACQQEDYDKVLSCLAHCNPNSKK